VRPWQACVLTCVILAGTSGELAGSELYCELVVGVVAPSEPVGSFLVKIY